MFLRTQGSPTARYASSGCCGMPAQNEYVRACFSERQKQIDRRHVLVHLAISRRRSPPGSFLSAEGGAWPESPTASKDSKWMQWDGQAQGGMACVPRYCAKDADSHFAHFAAAACLF
ncbi:hypothetical protein H4R99_007533 [Coemansia sp. RSA 1722]|nr:hypothetical protein IWW45_008579 [Coemansia sp. RSA 485]KAJ2589231.1 hypothetical protein H4R99_007533 [Coemansia sp. RSA 1722]